MTARVRVLLIGYLYGVTGERRFMDTGLPIVPSAYNNKVHRFQTPDSW